MFVEQRTYTLVPGSQAEWLDNYEQYGLEVQKYLSSHSA